MALNIENDRVSIAERLIAIGEACARVAPVEWRSRNFDDELYDEQGMPR
jgi:hypothetical protein